MEKIKIISDSTCDLTKEEVASLGVEIVPVEIILGSECHLDGDGITSESVLEYVKNTGELPQTAATNSERYEETFKKFVDEGYKVIHFDISSKSSSMYFNAVAAAEKFNGNVFVVDSMALSSGQGLLIMKTCDYIKEGKSFDEICEILKELPKKVQTSFVVDTLEFLHKGGRCSSVAKFGANVLGIKPSIAVNTETGTLEVSKKYRGKPDIVYRQYANDRLNEIKRIRPDRVVIANSGGISPETLAFVRGVIDGKDIFDNLILADAGCTISSHCGPKTLAIFYIKK